MAAPDRQPPPAAASHPAHPFPETQTAVLVRAAGGDWEPFFAEYLAPCWREIVLACRGRLPADAASDLLQELAVRLLRDGRSRPVPGEADGEAAVPRGNIPHRFLARRAGADSARFRTYLKQVICNLIAEQVRRTKRAKPADPNRLPPPEQAVEDSVSTCLDRRWVLDCLPAAARQFRVESEGARTKARQRWFELLYLATVRGLSAAAIAGRLGLHRTTVVTDLAAARARFVALLGELSGVSSPAELKAHVAADPTRLFAALELVRGQAAAGISAARPERVP
jgi:DNA-directed RNA polymerase specialized sigma24 family protein